MTNSIVKYESKDGQEITLTPETVQRYLVRGSGKISGQETMYFLGICKSRGLNPFKGDAYLIKYGNDPAAIITSIDFFRARARKQPDCQGWKKGIIVQKKDGGLRYSNGLILEGEKLVGGWFEAQPKGWYEPFTLEVNLNGYIKKTRQGETTKFWSPENQPTMIAKVAESQGLRTLWPDEFQGLYDDSEINTIDIQPIIQNEVEELKKNLQNAKPVSHETEVPPEQETEQAESLPDPDPDPVSASPEPEPDPPKPIEETGNWWDDYDHWQYRRGDMFSEIVKLGLGYYDADYKKLRDDNPDCFGTLLHAQDETFEKVHTSFVGRKSLKFNRHFTENDWKTLTESGKIWQEGTPAPGPNPEKLPESVPPPEPPKESEPEPVSTKPKTEAQIKADEKAEEKAELEMYRDIMQTIYDYFYPPTVAEAKQQLGYRLGDGPATSEEAKALHAKCIELSESEKM